MDNDRIDTLDDFVSLANLAAVNIPAFLYSQGPEAGIDLLARVDRVLVDAERRRGQTLPTWRAAYHALVRVHESEVKRFHAATRRSI